MKTITWSFGGGVQSVYIALCIDQGLLPKPEITVMSDTGRERSSTWAYKAQYVDPLLAKHGITIEVAPHSLATVDLYGGNGDLLLPAFTGSGGKLPTFCSVEWKRRVVRRFLKAKGVTECVTWLGMSRDEVERLKPSDVAWQEYQWPLVFDVPVTRQQCLQRILDYGWPEPPKSSCYMCPLISDKEWRSIKETDPADFQQAIAIEQSIREKGQDVYLHRSLNKLADVDFLHPKPSPLFDECDSGFCFT